MELFRRPANPEEKFRYAFRELMGRMTVKGTNHLRHRYHSMPLERDKNLSKELESPQKLPSPIKDLIPASKAFKPSSFFNRKPTISGDSKRLPIKGSLSNRHNNPLTIQKRFLDSKMQEYNQLIITKSSLFSQTRGYKPRTPGIKPSKTNVCNFKTKQSLKEMKKNRITKKHPFIDNQKHMRMKTQSFDRAHAFEPWETAHPHDLF